MSGSLFDYPDTPATRAELTLLADATEAEWAVIREHAEQRRYRAGEPVVGRHDAERVLWVVVEGRFSAGSRSLAPVELGPGAVFGELTFLTGEPATVDVRALEPGSTLRLRLADLEVLAGIHPALVRHLLFDLARLLAVQLRDCARLVSRR
jgi:CRP-like cAMP-binding protein